MWEVTTEEMYKWIESTEYLTEYGRSPDADWHPFYPSYQASLQLRWQRMVNDGKLIRKRSGVYQLPHSQVSSPTLKWAQMVETDQEVTELTAKKVTVQRIQRSQKLRDLLVNYYDSHCQICGDNSPFLIPTEIAGRFYVEVHHVNGLAESYALQRSGLRVGLRVNGLENLTVLCPHHHATLHHHWPHYEFDRKKLLWWHTQGGVLPINHIKDQHKQLIQRAVVE